MKTTPTLRPYHDPVAHPVGIFGGFGFRKPLAFFDPADDGGAGTMTTEAFQKKVLEGVGTMKKQTEDTINSHKELKDLCEKTFKDYETKCKDLAGMASKVAELERKALEAASTARRGLPLAERLLEHEDTLKKIGEAVKKYGTFHIVRSEGEDTSSTGANLVNPALLSDIYALEQDYGAAKLLDYRTMGTKTEKLLVETSEPDAVFVSENGVIPEQGLSLAQTAITARKIAAIIGISIELLDDSVVDLGAYTARKFARANARRTDYVAFNGNGQSDAGGQNGGFIGVFNAATQINAAATHTTVEKMDFLDFLLPLTTVDPAVLENPDACWMVHPTMLIRFLSVMDGNKRPIFLNALDAPARGGIGSILGYPVKLISQAPRVNGPGLPVAAFGDPKAYSVGNRKDYQFDLSDHARFESAQRCYRGISRKAFGMRQPLAIVALKTAAA